MIGVSEHWSWKSDWRINEKKLTFIRILFRLLPLAMTMPRIRNLVENKPLSPFARKYTIVLKKGRVKLKKSISCHLDWSEAIIRRFLHELGKHGRTQHKKGRLLPRETTERKDRAICRSDLISLDSSLSNNSTCIQDNKTINKRLEERGLNSWRPLRRLPLTYAHRQARLQWCKARSIWSFTVYSTIIFSDETRFELSFNDQRRLPGDVQDRREILTWLLLNIRELQSNVTLYLTVGLLWLSSVSVIPFENSGTSIAFYSLYFQDKKRNTVLYSPILSEFRICWIS